MHPNIHIQKWNSTDVKARLDEVKTLRKNYADFPYLYKYDDEVENKYFEQYLHEDNLMDCWVAMVGCEIIGMSLGCPMSKQSGICSHVCELTDYKKAYYFGDIAVARDYQKYGIASALYAKHIDQVKEMGFEKICALLVEREDDDPRTPKGYVKPKLWQQYGFVPINWTVSFEWETFQLDGTSREELNLLRLYEKSLVELS